ncbi:hypothetical protein GQ607_004504 [Colletotrichum asianum]|uniref:Uncharacterized protein n=1 Tax=Colletotrichum asianum TaxID=702518 RepID=A0A8H3WPQ2_9PEZI|nr:hypothetical protein GQ607_004504 [Colletotrichum asianum]
MSDHLTLLAVSSATNYSTTAKTSPPRSAATASSFPTKTISRWMSRKSWIACTL